MDSPSLSAIWGNPSMESLRSGAGANGLSNGGRSTPSRRLYSPAALQNIATSRAANNMSPSVGWNLVNGNSSQPTTPSKLGPPPGLGFPPAATGSHNQSAREFMQRYQSAKTLDNTKNALIEDLFAYIDRLELNQEKAGLGSSSDDAQWNAAAERLAEEKEQALAENQRLRAKVERDPFFAVLLDVDELSFDENLLAKGEQGGADAATLLSENLNHYLQLHFANLKAPVRVSLRAYANMEGLAAFYTRTGVIADPPVFDQFVKGFNSSQALFDLTDAGNDSKHIDEKLIGLFKHHLFDYRCRQIFLGCSNREPILSLLEAHARDAEAVQRVTLLRSVKSPHRLPYQTTTLYNTLRPTKALTATRPQHLTSSPAPAMSRTSSTASLLRAASNPSTDPDSELTGAASPASTNWATVASKSAQEPTQKPAMQTQSAPVLRNRKGQRIDLLIKHDKDEVERVKKLKICNTHFLRGSCPYGDACTHKHNYKPTGKELTYLALVARMAPCMHRSECDDARCIYGHACPAPEGRSGELCIFGDKCRFPDEMHGVDRLPVKVVRV